MTRLWRGGTPEEATASAHRETRPRKRRRRKSSSRKSAAREETANVFDFDTSGATAGLIPFGCDLGRLSESKGYDEDTLEGVTDMDLMNIVQTSQSEQDLSELLDMLGYGDDDVPLCMFDGMIPEPTKEEDDDITPPKSNTGCNAEDATTTTSLIESNSSEGSTQSQDESLNHVPASTSAKATVSKKTRRSSLSCLSIPKEKTPSRLTTKRSRKRILRRSSLSSL
mmetsp:Transcript_31692/g.59095  ORF Transcript_31692/g.59095 Transcript_31692/m.59095 type:complete len:225 (-) Transcript_31692:241-915(-)|eukprot:CAMPEP_0170172192 /NCGR_PEP_ID=MMETSP0040_2-20121228/5428_1 /TAXON_ID=641309 /ORGANISM="Lotharella oceanica, Strain CCMP622" /LENGTH=224 /DNA_ID=CAMNT_0010412735 /DNA_START=38 /DNA_END=712 /DNA_ORIENTATION=-